MPSQSPEYLTPEYVHYVLPAFKLSSAMSADGMRIMFRSCQARERKILNMDLNMDL